MLRFNTKQNVCHFTRNNTHKPLLMTTRKEEKRREHKKSNKNVTLWERKNNALRFIEDEDRTLTTVSDWGRSSSVSSVGGTSVQHTNNENEDALEVLANSVNVCGNGKITRCVSSKTRTGRPKRCPIGGDPPRCPRLEGACRTRTTRTKTRWKCSRIP